MSAIGTKRTLVCVASMLAVEVKRASPGSHLLMYALAPKFSVDLRDGIIGRKKEPHRRGSFC